MILGRAFFVNPSDSVAVIAANASAIPYFKSGLKGLARSMPTSGALDLVAKDLGVHFFEVPTGKIFSWYLRRFIAIQRTCTNLITSLIWRVEVFWKFDGCRSAVYLRRRKFRNWIWSHSREGWCMGCLRYNTPFTTPFSSLPSYNPFYSSCLCLPWYIHIAWLSILASRNTDSSKPFVRIETIVREHWAKYGRNYFSRYDYEEVSNKVEFFTPPYTSYLILLLLYIHRKKVKFTW